MGIHPTGDQADSRPLSVSGRNGPGSAISFRTHVFPGDDVGGRNNLRRWLRLRKDLDYEGVRRTLAPWRHYGGLIYFHLLLDRLAEAGYLQAEHSPEPASGHPWQPPSRGRGPCMIPEPAPALNLSEQRARGHSACGFGPLPVCGSGSQGGANPHAP
jgi:hypothetical protein